MSKRTPGDPLDSQSPLPQPSPLPVGEAASPAGAADIALLLEGTFPYVQGGVSSWVDLLIRAFPELTFSVVFIGSRRGDYGAPRYPMPANVVHFEAHFLYEIADTPVGATVSQGQTRRGSGDPEAFAQIARMHDLFRQRHERHGGREAAGDDTSIDDLHAMLSRILPMLRDGRALAQPEFLHSERAWDFITQRYERFCHDPSFTDYFWTIRAMHKPIWQLAGIAGTLPPARVYHTVSTGYAGLLGAMLRMSTGRPLLVTEHGSYTKERKLDLLQSEWLRDNRGPFERDISRVGYFQTLWMRFFEAIGRVCYDTANEIVSLYEGNRLRQVSDGAPVHKTRCIANGVDIARFAALRVDRRETDAQTDRSDIPAVVALVGRVVPVKDIKTFLRAIFIAYRERPDLQGWIVGPDSEDAGYAQECRDLAASLGMEYQVQFMGYREIESVLPHIGVLALSSVSEALPLVMLEAAAAGVPVVATDVGACRQLIDGDGAEDRALGCSGRIVPMADPEALAAAIVDVLEPGAWHAASRAGIARVERHYRLDAMRDAYRTLYRRWMDGGDD
ncbi:GT4 family glycosyltransferase PelF [Pandoraea fibrosis]|uniref:Glycosyl transferase family 1 n=1 Tax=Pandoraea fibrosis TaxID=1891094 RepID=A0A5E4SHI4_9BURK|nr:GT4 family glycosyltransferase PelF [Pandoraea fibrosis]VVD73479.1 glycosyl transferase family 1 [Pandoraea fibrosis]